MPKYYKTIIKVEVLSEGKYNPEDLEQVHMDITDGDCSGKWDIESSTKLTSKQAAKALIAQGSAPEFFMLDEEGNRVD